jgi:hypothetical protein
MARVLRRSGTKFVPLGFGERVSPGEAIRLQASGTDRLGVNSPEFTIVRDGIEVFRQKKRPHPISGNANIDTRAPQDSGTYSLIVHQSGSLATWRTHAAEAQFTVSQSAQRPIDPAPKGGIEGALDSIFGNLKKIALLTVIVAGVGIVVLVLVRRTATKVVLGV